MHSGRFDPRAKLAAITFAVVATFSIRTLWNAGLLTGAMLLAALATQTPLRRIGRNIALISWLLMMTGGLNFWGTLSANTVLSGQHVMIAAFIQSLVAIIQLALVVGWISIFNASLSPLEMVAGVELLLRPCQRFGLPIGNISVVAMMTLRFLPILFDEAHQLMQTVIARGMDWHAETWRGRAKCLLFLCIGLFNSLLRRVELLTDAMENRDFTIGAARTSFYTCCLCLRDYLLIGGSFLGFICCILL